MASGFIKKDARRIAGVVLRSEAAAKANPSSASGSKGGLIARATCAVKITSEIGSGFYGGTSQMWTGSAWTDASRSFGGSDPALYEINGTEALTADGSIVVTATLYRQANSAGDGAWIFTASPPVPKRSIEFDTTDEADGQLQLVGDKDSVSAWEMYGKGASAQGYVPTTAISFVEDVRYNDALDQFQKLVSTCRVFNYVEGSWASYADGGGAIEPTPDPIAPDDITSATGVYWIEARLESGYVNNDDVTTPVNQFGGTDFFTQSTESLRPLYKTSQFGAQPAFVGDGSDDFWDGGEPSGLNFMSTDDFTCVVISGISGSTQVVHARGDLVTMQQNQAFLIYISGGTDPAGFFRGSSGNSFSQAVNYTEGGSPCIWIVTKTDTEMNLWINGVLRATHTITPGDISFSATRIHRLMADQNSSGDPQNFLSVPLAAYLVYSGEMSDADIAGLTQHYLDTYS